VGLATHLHGIMFRQITLYMDDWGSRVRFPAEAVGKVPSGSLSSHSYGVKTHTRHTISHSTLYSTCSL
jgi:hypothetical protein